MTVAWGTTVVGLENDSGGLQADTETQLEP